MITAIVRFKVPAGLTLAQAQAKFEESAPKYRELAGLIRKYYLFDGQGTAGGGYLWESRAAADAVYTPEWKAYITERYGAAPEILYFETPVVVDNVIGEIQAAAE